MAFNLEICLLLTPKSKNMNKKTGIIAAIGAAIGGFAFWKYKNMTPEEKAALKDKADDFVDKAKETFEKVSDKASELGKEAMESAKEGMATVSEKVKEASHDAKEKWDEVAGEVSQKVKDAKEDLS